MLAPSNRPVQVTENLALFWRETVRSPSARKVAKPFIPDLEEFAGRLLGQLPGHCDSRPMKSLNRVHERRAIVLSANVRPDLKYVIGTKTNEVAIESRVMQLA
jgi:hypothetical protein